MESHIVGSYGFPRWGRKDDEGHDYVMKEKRGPVSLKNTLKKFPIYVKKIFKH